VIFQKRKEGGGVKPGFMCRSIPISKRERGRIDERKDYPYSDPFKSNTVNKYYQYVMGM